MLQQVAATSSTEAKQTALSPIPVVFHFVLTQDKYTLLGGDSGVKRRVRTQLETLNRDYSATNPDRVNVPAVWSNLVDDIGVVFGLANATSANTIAPGIEVRIVTNPPNYNVNNGCSDAKHTANGLPAWDNTKYLNVWVTNIFGGSSHGTILGVTIPPSFTGMGGFPDDEKGIVLNYGAVGARDFSAQYFITWIDQGRTLTHEMGHYFELKHIWGDDGGLCPGNGGDDDDIADTPPQADATYCSAGNCPTFPKYDACSATGNGIMFMNYMDYVDDAAMYMFTKDQGDVMRSQFAVPGAPSYSLTQNPGLSTVGVRETTSSIPGWHLSPNPAQDALHLSLEQPNGFKGLEILSLTGQVVMQLKAISGTSHYDMDLKNLPRGFYIARCLYNSGAESKKLVLQ